MAGDDEIVPVGQRQLLKLRQLADQSGRRR